MKHVLSSVCIAKGSIDPAGIVGVHITQDGDGEYVHPSDSNPKRKRGSSLPTLILDSMPSFDGNCFMFAHQKQYTRSSPGALSNTSSSDFSLMLHVVEAGTDVASLWIFDPAALPEDFDTRFPADPTGVLDQLEREGLLVSVNTGADGGYLLHAFIDEPVTESLERYAVDPLTFSALAVPSGRLYFVGGEFGSREVERHLARYPHMGGSFTVHPGKYRLTLWRTEYPDDHQERLFKAQVSDVAFKVHQSIGWLIMAAVAGAVLVTITWLIGTQSRWQAALLAVEAILICLPWIVTRLPVYRNADENWQAIGRQYPSLVAHLIFEGDL